MRILLHRLGFALALYLFGAGYNFTLAQVQEHKIALVIGNTEYINRPRLRNATRDALAVAQALANKGFTVFFAKDVDASKMKEFVNYVAGRAVKADQIVVYYAGHNEIHNGATHLIPISSKGSMAPADSQSISIPDLLDAFDVPFAQKAFILDTCLQDPSTINATSAQSLSLPKSLGMETLLVLATSFGQAAYDGSGDHSVFTGAFLDSVTKDDFDIQGAIQSIRSDVIQASRANQIPVTVSTLSHPYILNAQTASSHSLKSQNDLIQSYSSTGFADKPLLDAISEGINPTGF